MKIKYQFIIDTDSYAGNFERELCGFVTGIWDGETHGEDQARLFEQDFEINPFDSYISRGTDHDGMLSPVTIINSKNNKYDSIVIYFNNEIPQELINIMVERSHRFAKEGKIFDRPVQLKILGFRLRRIYIFIEDDEL